MVIYAAGKTLYVKSVQDGKEQKHYVFRDQISSLNLDPYGNLLVTQGGQVIKLLKDSMHTNVP